MVSGSTYVSLTRFDLGQVRGWLEHLNNSELSALRMLLACRPFTFTLGDITMKISLRMLATALCTLLALLCPPSSWAQDKTVRLTSLDWPPYSGAKLRQQGASIAVAQAAFKTMGYTLVVDFYPWSRAVNLAKDDANYAGYFPEYFAEDIRKDFIFSASMGTGPLGFAERVDEPHPWKSLDDLSKLRVGVVQDYVNTEAFDTRVAQKKIQADVATSDAKNLLKLAGKRIDLAVVDHNVFNYLLQSTPELKDARTSLRFNDKLLEDKDLFICFKKGPEGEKWTKVFNEGLKKINAAAIFAQALGTP